MATDATAEARERAEIEKKSTAIRRFWELVLGYKLRDSHLGQEMVSLVHDMLTGLVPHLGETLPADPERMPMRFVGQKALKLDPFPEPWPIGCRARELYLAEDGSWIEHGMENDSWITIHQVAKFSCWPAFLDFEGGLKIAMKKHWKNVPDDKELRKIYDRQAGLSFQFYQARLILQTLPDYHGAL